MQKERCFKGCLKENKIRRHAELDSASSTLAVLQENSNNTRGRSRIKYGMTTNFDNNGFTLIELLVVVLIIGILAAVAVPQYTLAVDKAKLSNLMSIMQSLKDAQERYYLANNVYATTIDELDIDVPANAEYTLNFSSAPQGIYGKYNNLKNIILTAAQNHATGAGSEYKGIWICYAKKTDARANKLCQYLAKTKNNGWSAETGQGPSYAYGFSR